MPAFFCCCFLLLALSSNLRIWTIMKLMGFVCKMFQKREFDLLKRIIVIGNYVCCGSNKGHWNNRKYFRLHCVCVQCTLYVCVIHKYTHTFFIIGWYRNVFLLDFQGFYSICGDNMLKNINRNNFFHSRYEVFMKFLFFKRKCYISTEAFKKCHITWRKYTYFSIQ